MAISFLLKSFLTLIILLSSPTIKANTQCLDQQKALLLELKNQLVYHSHPLSRFHQWNATVDCCNWAGVGCDDAGRVTSLGLWRESISGGLNESSSLFGLYYLEKLDLSSNLLEESDIQTHIHKLTHLTSLILSNCSLKGYFSDMIFQLPNLQLLDLSSNPLLSGNLPQTFPQNSSFETILLADTNFSGSLPDSVTTLQRLSRLDLSNCKFTGAIPFALGNLTQLEYVDLSYNFFTGSISSINFEGLSRVVSMDLGYNLFIGTVPVSVFTLPSLIQIYLQHNRFSGRVAEFSIVNMSKLSILDLSSNRLESPIPNAFFGLQTLKSFFLADNMFNETFLLEKILSLPNLDNLDLSNNHLSLYPTTSIPNAASSSNNSSLSFLDLSNNKIAGEIPSWIWEIGNGSLFYLNLSCNMLVDLQKPYNVPASLSLFLLDLHSNRLVGEWPSALIQRAHKVDLSNNFLGIGNLSAPLPFLTYLSLKNNSLSGSLSTFCNVKVLFSLDLSVNNLSGSIPDCLYGSIQVLNLGRNNITGRIADKFSPSCILISLDLSYNKIVGDVPLSLANCSTLKVVNLSYNKLSGTVPTSLAQNEHLAVLNLGGNNITGRIPNFASNCNLQYLVLNNNNLTGEIPISLANCSSLRVMNVGNNQIEDSFPCMLPSSLQVLVLRSNRFNGEVRCDPKSWPKLQIIDIASNNFSGYLNPLNFSTWGGMMRDTVKKLSYKTLDFTTELIVSYYREEVTLTIKGVEQKLVKIWPDFTSIDLSSNNFQGHIPGEIGALDGLYFLNLSHNSLTGLIPKSFSNTTWLGALDLSMNQLTGKIPKELAGLTFLQLMNVSHNKLVGQIPVSTQIQSFSPDCFEGNAGLCGLPLNITCSNTEPAAMLPIMESEIEWEYVFAAAGFAVGLGIFSWLLLFCQTFRYKYFDKIEEVVLDKIFGFCQKTKKKQRGKRPFIVRLSSMVISLLVQILMILILLSAANTATDAHTRIQCLEHQKALLLDLKKQLVFNSSLSSKLAQRNQTDDWCSWEGVECDVAGHVSNLQLDQEAISGGLNESSSLFSLKYLEKLDLSNNFLKD